MRLSAAERNLILEAVAACLGPGARVRLFGSRVVDTGRGGDIDLLVEPAGPVPDPFRAELKLAAALQARLGERRVDVVLHQPGQPMSPITALAAQTGVPL